MEKELSNRKKIIKSAKEKWVQFLERRQKRLLQLNRPEGGAEKITEGILEDLFSMVLNWSISDLNWQMGRCDLVLTQMGIKYLLLEAKYPNHFSSKSNREKALNQVLGYAKEQKVKKIAVSDGYMLLIAELDEQGAIEKYLEISLDAPDFSEELWFLSIHGIYRSIPRKTDIAYPRFQNDGLLHHKYELPIDCFAYVGDKDDTKTWKLPYLLEDSSVDVKRLSKAIGAVISNYRGAKVEGIPEKAIPSVLRALEKAARQMRKMPDQDPKASDIYKKLADILVQFSAR